MAPPACDLPARPPSYATDAAFRDVWARCRALAGGDDGSVGEPEDGADVVAVSVLAVRELLASRHLLRAAYLFWTHDSVFLSHAIRTCTTLLLSWLEQQRRRGA